MSDEFPPQTADSGTAAVVAAAVTVPSDELTPTAAHGVATRADVSVDPSNFWRLSLVAVAVVALGSFLWFVLDDAGQVIFTLLISWFTALAMEPAVARLSLRMKRGAATGVVMLSAGAFLVLFGLAFGKLIAEQLVQAAQALPSFAADVVEWLNRFFGTDYSGEEILTAIGVTQESISEWVTDLAGGALGLIVSGLSALFSSFTFLLFTFYFSADAPRLKRWLAALFPERYQSVFGTTWDLAVEKTGGYVSARVVLAFINGSTTSLFMWIIGMPYWLVLGIWTGIVAQFIPTIGTYIAIILPTVVGLLSPEPVDGLLVLAWGLLYQQIENLSIEPKISAKAVDVHPAVSFASVMLGAALFGASGAILAIPVAATVLALFDIYGHKHELLPQLTAPAPVPVARTHFIRRRRAVERTSEVPSS